MKPLLPSKNKKQSKIVLLENDHVITDPLSVAEKFNEHFCEVAGSDGDRLKVDDFKDHPSVQIIAEKNDLQSSFNFIPVEERYIKELLEKLNPRKAVGCDNISQRLLRLSAPALAQPLTRLINHFITERVWPSVWKSSNISPIFKKLDETDKTNYRPVSVLTALSKILEKIILDQIYTVFHERLLPNLSGYLKGHSCCTALLKMTEDWRASLDQRETVAAVAVDLIKAFDTACHNLLLAKLRAYGFSDEAVELMSSYLHGRRQRVRLDNVFSEWRPVITGVPQGSLLGPLLFNLYVNDINYFITSSSLRIYADDTTEYASDPSPIALQYIVNADLKQLNTWLVINYLNLNIPKTQATVTGPSSYELAANEIEVTDSLKILGVTLDRKLTFRSHIKDQLRKACAKAAALRRLRRFVPQDVMIRLYKAYILPQLEYCSPLLLGIGKVEQGKMEDTNEYLLRTLLGVPKSTTYETLLKRAGIETLHQRRLF